MSRWISAFALIVFTLNAEAMVVQTKVLRSRAFSKKLNNGIFASLDLKQKKIKFTESDLNRCRKNLKRDKRTLKYSCQLWIPTQATTSVLNAVETPEVIEVRIGQLSKSIQVSVSEDGKSIRFSTEFDNSAVDFDFAEFNTEVFNVFDEAAHLLISRALTQQGMRLKILEN